MTTLRIVCDGNGYDDVNVFGLDGTDPLHHQMRPKLEQN